MKPTRPAPTELRKRGTLLLLGMLATAVACSDPPVAPPVDRPNSLFGVVRIQDSEVLLPGVRVWVENVDEVETTPNGGYFLEGMDEGIVRVFAEFEGHELYDRRVRIEEGSNTHDIFLIPLTAPLARAR